MYRATKIKRFLRLESAAILPEQFAGDSGRDQIRRSLSNNPAIQNDLSIVKLLIEQGATVFFRKGDQIIKQGAQDCDVYFLLSGEVDIVFGSRLGSKREAPNQVGEMAAIEPGKVRSASVIAHTNEVAALKVCGFKFNKIWLGNSRFKELLQMEMSSRHRERIVAGEIARQNNSSSWNFISICVGLVVAFIVWLLIGAYFLNWTDFTRSMIAVGVGVLSFAAMALYNPVFFWRRCAGMIGLAMIGTVVLGKFITIEAVHGIASLNISIISESPETGLGNRLVGESTFLAAFIICAIMDFMTSRK